MKGSIHVYIHIYVCVTYVSISVYPAFTDLGQYTRHAYLLVIGREYRNFTPISPV